MPTSYVRAPHTAALVSMSLLLASCGPREFAIKSAPAEAQAILENLNKKDRAVVDSIERPDGRHDVADDGEVGGWIWVQKRRLAQLGLSAKWNPVTRRYHLEPAGKSTGASRER